MYIPHSFTKILISFVPVLGFTFTATCSADAPIDSGKVDFIQQIQPIFRKHCFECHSADKEDGGLNLGIRRRAIEGGYHGPAWTVGKSSESRLIQFVSGANKDTVMPPDSDGLSQAEVELLKSWIDQGADWPKGIDIPDPRFEKAKTHFAFQPIHSVNEPEVVNARWTRNAIDQFILARLESAGISPAPQTNARQLIRRVTFDLIGLPPTLDEVADFCAASEHDFDQAYAALVDRLLSSAHYGERWGRHWLDVARYADSDGQESDRDRNNAYHFRDFVIQSLNNDMPYDQFVRWQLAGDEYEPDNPQAVAAVGFLSSGPFAALPSRLMEDERLRQRYNELDDILSTVGTGFLGLTLGCVRCHDHKYDAIPTHDYYSLLNAFHGGERGEVEVGPDKTKVFTYRDLTPEPIATWLFQRGNFYDRDQPVTLSFISILTGNRSPDEYWQQARHDSPNQTSTKQRRAVAQWITDLEQGAGALLARVIVNRVWMHHFGQGLVRTAGDFGVRADPPTHPELLEWLTHDFVTNGWRVKRLHRLILTSSVYRQGGSARPQPTDPDNRLLWKMPLQRLEGEVLRDAMLSASGTLNLKAFGPSIRPPVAAEARLARNVQDKYPEDIPDSPDQRRRSIYLFHKRVIPYPFLQAFDKPDAQQSCSRRDRTTVTPQALALLNEPFVRAVARDFADRLIKLNHSNSDVVRMGYQLALSRRPNDDELEWAQKFIEEQTRQRHERQKDLPPETIRQQAVADFCQVLFSLNEFSYVD
jgi:mono/diheme cytochrome c family protein